MKCPDEVICPVKLCILYFMCVCVFARWIVRHSRLSSNILKNGHTLEFMTYEDGTC